MPPPTAAQAILLVDGYNVIGAWPELARSQAKGGFDQARSDLVEILVNYSAFKGFETSLVFDAYSQPTPNSEVLVTHNLRVHYTAFGQTADTYIEKVCAQFRNNARKFTQRLIVATSDRAQQLTVVGYGAEWMSALQLAADVQVSIKGVKQKQRTRKKTANRLLANTLDPKVQEQLARLRLGLDP